MGELSSQNSLDRNKITETANEIFNLIDKEETGKSISSDAPNLKNKISDLTYNKIESLKDDEIKKNIKIINKIYSEVVGLKKDSDNFANDTPLTIKKIKPSYTKDVSSKYNTLNKIGEDFEKLF